MIEWFIHLPAWIALVIAISSFAYTVASGRSRVAKSEAQHDRDRAETRHNTLLDRTLAVEERVARLEGEVPHLPDKESFHRVELAIAQLDGKLAAMDERLKPVLASVSRVQDHLMEFKS